MRVAYPSFLATIKVMMLVLKIGDDEKTGYDPLVRATLKRKHWSRALGSKKMKECSVQESDYAAVKHNRIMLLVDRRKGDLLCH